ncbi:MAG: DUF368 domain-containing protein [Bacteroidetes bacterium]|nr:DUF368 domain-containing protein [Bacteroidota bacterium]
MKRNFLDYIKIALKGAGMGAADVVPGVSGGTIAFITNIYEELLSTIKSFNVKAFALLFSFKFKDFWKAINGNFLISLLFGIGLSVFSLAHIVTSLLKTDPILVWSFFFGLVLSSTYFVARRISKWTLVTMLMFVLGAVAAYFITVLTPAETPNSLFFIFICGMLAICAMILPGISGSFILLLLGKYQFLMNALKTLDLSVLLTFGVGAMIGIVSFSHVLSFLLKKYYNFTIAILSGFMLGSLNKVWPWKETVENGLDKYNQINILPNENVVEGLILMIMGFVLVYLLEVYSKKQEITE